MQIRNSNHQTKQVSFKQNQNNRYAAMNENLFGGPSRQIQASSTQRAIPRTNAGAQDNSALAEHFFGSAAKPTQPVIIYKLERTPAMNPKNYSGMPENLFGN